MVKDEFGHTEDNAVLANRKVVDRLTDDDHLRREVLRAYKAGYSERHFEDSDVISYQRMKRKAEVAQQYVKQRLG